MMQHYDMFPEKVAYVARNSHLSCPNCYL